MITHAFGAVRWTNSPEYARYLALREPLELSEEQVALLEALDERVRRENRALATQFRDSLTLAHPDDRGGAAEPRSGAREPLLAYRRLLPVLRENVRRAAVDAAAVLTPEQRGRVRTLVIRPPPH